MGVAVVVYDERDFTSRRYLVLLASKPQGNRDHGRVWASRGEAYLLMDTGRIETVTSVADWLRAVGLMKAGPERNLGGQFLVPTQEGWDRLDKTLHGSIKEEGK